MNFQIPSVLQRDNLSPAQKEEVEKLARGKANAVQKWKDSESSGAVAVRGFVGNIVAAGAGGLDRVAPSVPIGSVNVPASAALALGGAIGGFFFDAPMVSEAAWYALAHHSYVAGWSGMDRMVLKYTAAK